MMKADSAYRTITEVADLLQVQASVLRFWETQFSQIKPIKRMGGRRYYRAEDVVLLAQIRDYLYKEGLTTKGVQRRLKQE
ncbi:MAG: MerR family transcriptional regulator, partial [Clostridia bacterium]|nr:MerR family transcriptional regulator [Clostridia bacterium]